MNRKKFQISQLELRKLGLKYLTNLKAYTSNRRREEMILFI